MGVEKEPLAGADWKVCGVMFLCIQVECKNQQEGSQIPENDSSQQAN